MKAVRPDRFWAHVQEGAEVDACWVWSGPLDRDGYGRADRQLAHRVAYEINVGPIPDGLTIDHLCRNRGCVNPAHLEPVTRAENMRRRSAAQTHCKQGHAFDEHNTYIKYGWRNCRKCGAASTRRYMARKASSP